MAINIIKNSGHVAYGIKDYILDTTNDIQSLPTDTPGSTAFIIADSSTYILNGSKQWVKITN